MLIELTEATITRQCDDRAQGSLNSQHIALVFGDQVTSNRREGLQILQPTFHGPGPWGGESSQLLECNRLQAVNHLLPLGAKGRRESLTEPALVAVAVTVCWAIC